MKKYDLPDWGEESLNVNNRYIWLLTFYPLIPLIYAAILIFVSLSNSTLLIILFLVLFLSFFIAYLFILNIVAAILAITISIITGLIGGLSVLENLLYILYMIITLVVLPTHLFILDRNALRDSGAIVPLSHWVWVLFFPIYFLIPVLFFFPFYIFRRQMLNKFSLNIFWIYMVTTFIILPVIMGVLSSLAK